MQDIFVPESKPEDALVHQLHTVTIITHDRERFEAIFTEGYGLTSSGWVTPDDETRSYLGFSAEHDIATCGFTKTGEGANLQVRVIHVAQETPQVRPEWMGLYEGGATLSFPMVDLRTHEKRMNAIGVESTIGVKEMDFTSPAGETYTSAEIVYKAPEHIFVMGVTRPEIFVPTGPIDPETGLGGPSYSARCITKADAVNDFLANVLGYEIRRDTYFEVGERSALHMPEGTKERFIQAFAPGASTGYLVLMDHEEATRPSPAPGRGAPNRGIAMWSFETGDIDEVRRRAGSAGITIVQDVAERSSPLMPRGRTMILEDPDGFPIEIVEPT
ncbi:VOC family protein [Altererythrobacter sp. MF3-039]|uniref:VOC family protein n=1 Tax=Altererythrobacter sp. MF3-039 TaxID=3252901 RepID=UPI00390C5F44